jgi:hypothetical protein
MRWRLADFYTGRQNGEIQAKREKFSESENSETSEGQSDKGELRPCRLGRLPHDLLRRVFRTKVLSRDPASARA